MASAAAKWEGKVGNVRAARVAANAWRPLGRVLVQQGLLTDEELELALATQQITGKRLGETIVESSFISRPDLSNALAAQYGIVLTTETGFGTGLRAQIQQRHESNRERPVTGDDTPRPKPVVIEAEPEETKTPAAEPVQLSPLEEQWAKLEAAEMRLDTLAAECARLRAQAGRFARRARRARAASE